MCAREPNHGWIKQDVINFGYIGLLEEDYEWVTQQLVQVANRYSTYVCTRGLAASLYGVYSSTYKSRNEELRKKLAVC